MLAYVWRGITSDGLDLSQGLYGRYEQPTTSIRPRANDAGSRRARLKKLWRAADTDENHNKEGDNGADYSPSNRRPDACDRINLESGGAWKTDRRLHRPCTHAPARLRDAFLARLPSSNKRWPPQSGERQRGGLAAYSVSLRLVRRLLSAADGIYLASRCGARKKREMPAVLGWGTWFIQPKPVGTMAMRAIVPRTSWS
jgi:hypothetical protein